MAAGDMAGKVMRMAAGVMSEIDPKSTLKYMGKNNMRAASQTRAYKAGAKATNFLGGGVKGTVKNMTSKKNPMGFGKAIKSAHSGVDGKLDYKKVAGTTMGLGMAGRVVTGGGLYKDRNGNTNLPGIPFI